MDLLPAAVTAKGVVALLLDALDLLLLEFRSRFPLVGDARLLAGDPDEVDILPFDELLLEEDVHRPAVTALDDDGHGPGVGILLPSPAALVVADEAHEIVDAGGVPDDALGVLGLPDEEGGRRGPVGTPAPGDDVLDLLLVEETPYFLAEVLDLHHQASLLSIFWGPRGLRASTKSPMISVYFFPSAAETQDIRKRSGSRPVNSSSSLTRAMRRRA